MANVYKTKIGKINDVDIKLCNHFKERQEQRLIEELYVFKAISLCWDQVKNQKKAGTYMAIKVDMRSIYDCFDEVLEKTPQFVYSKCCDHSIVRRNRGIYTNRLLKRSDNSIMLLVVDWENKNTLTVVTSLITKREPVVKRKTILFDLTKKEAC